jgi:hypothetical protein
MHDLSLVWKAGLVLAFKGECFGEWDRQVISALDINVVLNLLRGVFFLGVRFMGDKLTYNYKNNIQDKSF